MDRNVGQLAEGCRFTAVPDPKFKTNRIAVYLITPLDAEFASDNAVVPSLLRRGKDFTALNRRLDEMYGAALFADVTRFGRYQVLTLSATGLDDRFALEGESLVKGIAELLCELLWEPNLPGGTFPAADVELEKNNLLDAIRAEINDKRSYALNRCASVMFAGESYAVKKYGTEEQARAITPESATAAYRRLMESAALEVLFIGPGDSDAAYKVFADRLKSKSRIAGKPAYTVRKAAERAVIREEEALDIIQGKLVMAWRHPAEGTERERLVIRMMSALYGGTPFSKLFLNVRERLSLCYYCMSHYERGTNVLMVDSGIEFSNREKAESEILAQLDAIRRGDFTDTELEHTKLALKNSLRTVGDSLSTLDIWYSTQILLDGAVSPEQEADQIDSVTREEIISAAKGFVLDTVFFLTGNGAGGEEAHS